MNNNDGMVLLLLNSGLFPDTDPVQQAVDRLGEIYQLKYRDLTDSTMRPDSWDQLLEEILGAEKVVIL